MADDKYSIDDILKEVDGLRGSEESPKSSFNGSVTDIIGGNEIDALLRAGAQRKAGRSSEEADAPRAAKQKKSDISVTQVIESISAKKKEPLAAKQRTDDEVSERIAGDISEAVNRRAENNRSAEDVILPARQRTDEEVEERIAKEINEAADVKIWQRLSKSSEEEREDSYGYSGASEDDGYGDNGGEYCAEPESEFVKPYVKPEVSGADDDIIFHTRGDLVTTDTMQMRKQQRIDDINQALLRMDSEAESPDEMLDSINPMETRAKAAEIVKSDLEPEPEDNTDTLAVAGNDLKRITHGEERIKEYKPAATRKKADDVLFTPTGIQHAAFPGGLHVGETIVEALNKKINEEKQAESKEKRRTEAESADAAVDENTQSGSINVIASAGEEPEAPQPENGDDPIEKIKRADEMARKKKRRIANFILDDMGNDTEEIAGISYSEDDEDDEEDDDPIDLDDENVVRDRLNRASKGLISRLIILLALLGITLFIAVMNAFMLKIGGLNKICSFREEPTNYLYTHLTIGILSFAACSSVISNGFSRLIKLRPDNDTLCAFAHMSAIIALIPYLSSAENIQLRHSHVYLLISLAALCFNTISKIFTVKTAQKNLEFTFGDNAKYFIERCDGDGAEQLAKGAVMGMPVVSSMRKTGMLCDFIISTYCEDISDRTARLIAPATAAAAFVCGIAAFFMNTGTEYVMNRVNWAITVCTAIFALGAVFSGSMTVTLPLLFASRKNKSRGSVILGYNAVEEFSETNAVLVDSKTLFPASSIKINNICGYDKPKNRCEGKINIDEAIIYAASLAVASDSILADAFFNMLNYKQELLKPVNGCVYESNLGVMGWIDRRRVLLGNRKHMKSHEITVPNMKKESAANVNNDEVIYLAVGGEVCLLFFVRLAADPGIKESVRKLAELDISLVIKTVDGMVTPYGITKLFGIESDNIRILPFEAHEAFNEHTRFVSSGSAALSCDGTFPSFAGALGTAKNLRDKAALGSILQLAGIGLGFLLAVIFMFFTNYDMFNVFFILLYNLGWASISLGAQFFKRP